MRVFLLTADDDGSVIVIVIVSVQKLNYRYRCFQETYFQTFKLAYFVTLLHNSNSNKLHACNDNSNRLDAFQT